MARYIKEIDLDPELIQKIFNSTGGSGVDIITILKDYVKFSDKIELSQLSNSVTTDYIEAKDNILQSKIDQCYKKGNQIQIGDLPPIIIQDINSLDSRVLVLENANVNLNKNITTIATQQINAYFTNNDIVAQAASQAKTSVETDIQPKFDTINNTLTDLTTKVNSNTAFITSTLPSTYRKISDKIKYTDLDSTVTVKFDTINSDITDLTNNKINKMLPNATGKIVKSMIDSTLYTDNLYDIDNYVYYASDRDYLLTHYKNKVIDLRNKIIYAINLNAWNYQISRDRTKEQVVNNVVDSANYKRYTISASQYKTNLPSGVTQAGDGYYTISATTTAVTFSYAFWGTKFKLNMQTPNASTINDMFVLIDGVSYDDVKITTTDSIKDACCVLCLNGLSEGKHLITLNCPISTTIKVNQYLDLDLTNAAILNTADFPSLSLYTGDYTLYNYVDTFTSVPSSYTTINKTSNLFDISTKTTTDLYNQTADTGFNTFLDSNSTINAAPYSNKILFSEYTQESFIISNENVPTIIRLSDGKKGYSANISQTIASNGTYTLVIPEGILNYNINVYSVVDAVLTPYTDYTINTSNNNLIVKNSTGSAINIVVAYSMM